VVKVDGFSFSTASAVPDQLLCFLEEILRKRRGRGVKKQHSGVFQHTCDGEHEGTSSEQIEG
jgi:hypothetical protein